MNVYGMTLNNSTNLSDLLGLKERISPFRVGHRVMQRGSRFDKLLSKVGVEHTDIFEEHKNHNYSRLRLGYFGTTDESDKEFSNYRFYQLAIRDYGTLRFGSSQKTECKCATIDQIRDCIKSTPPPKTTRPSGLYFNCQNDVEYAAQGCCLKGYKALNGMTFTRSTVYAMEGEPAMSVLKSREEELAKYIRKRSATDPDYRVRVKFRNLLISRANGGDNWYEDIFDGLIVTPYVLGLY